ncbi:alternative ribosome rescue aminoacyl-tRNA hydrolase ArfB [Spirosoma terrae]|uniref:Aminoacyl-tRNA hydrolase n=1 Tax=Spirosoma terrae TaxID=1968276 RepID=A0A6L9LDD8_9BACT|nr:alternative ribosome rescue aminoacyl-tRNA hydrolase ArfB [Spirosoma terrae]NDU97607.1 aminoacyl-tRNA hydrolase [Spirosoma terrae]
MDATRLQPDLHFQFARSGGAGGQHVNKVATKAELRFNVRQSTLLTDEERNVLEEKLANKLTTDGELVLTHQTERTQLANKEKVTLKFYRLIEKAFEPTKPRKATKPSKASIEERIAGKKRKSDVKASRKRIDY